MFAKCLSKVGLRTAVHLAVLVLLVGVISQSACTAIGCDCDAIAAELATIDPTSPDGICRSVQLTLNAIDCDCAGIGAVDQAARDAAAQLLQQFGCN